MRTDHTEIAGSPAAVDKPEPVVYARKSYPSIINSRQRDYLRRVIRSTYPVRRPVQHDFACGTGRAVRILSGLVREAHGYDTSPVMLERAAGMGLFAHWHEIKATGPIPEPATPEGPAIVTVFRLLVNVSEAVRDRAIEFAAEVLPTYASGLLVVENHGNAQSLRHLSRRRSAGKPWFDELSHHEVADLLARHGFTIVARHGFTMLPPRAYASRRPLPIVRRIDELLCRSTWLARYATNLLYVARRIE
jgi:SAM-dependent methyltransferase